MGIRLIKIFLLPVAILIVLIKPLIYIRFFEISNNSFGHFLQDTYIKIAFLNKEKKRDSLFCFNIFFLSAEKTVNKKVLEMWKKEINIFSHSKFLKIIMELITFLKKDKTFIPKVPWYENGDLVHSHSLKNFTLSKKDKLTAINFLKSLDINIEPEDKWICVYNRDNKYLEKTSNNLKEIKFNEYRNSDIKKNIEAINFFLEKGYYVFRVGKYSEEELKIKNKKFYDFTNQLNAPEEVLIYLMSNCELSFGAESGLRWLPVINKKKVAINNSPEIITETLSFYNNSIPFLPKKIFSNKKKDFLNLNEIFELKFYRTSNRQFIDYSDFSFYENTSEEILDFAREIYSNHVEKKKLSKDELDLKKYYIQQINMLCPRINNFRPELNNLYISLSFLKKNLNFLKLK